MKSDKIILKFEALADQVHGPVKRLIGFASARSMLGLFDAADLEANPRSAKVGPVTQAIIQSIESDPDVFPFKTKGVLIGCSDYEMLQRQRVELRFGEPRLEGVLDGGHNMLAIGTYILLGKRSATRARSSASSCGTSSRPPGRRTARLSTKCARS